MITEIEIEGREVDVLSVRFGLEDRTVIVFTINAKFNSYKHFKSMPISNIGEVYETFKK